MTARVYFVKVELSETREILVFSIMIKHSGFVASLIGEKLLDFTYCPSLVP